jgi:hypothetical protein
MLRAWVIASASLFGALFLVAYVPVLIPLIVIAFGLGCYAFGIARLARFIERTRKSD